MCSNTIGDAMMEMHRVDNVRIDIKAVIDLIDHDEAALFVFIVTCALSMLAIMLGVSLGSVLLGWL